MELSIVFTSDEQDPRSKRSNTQITIVADTDLAVCLHGAQDWRSGVEMQPHNTDVDRRYGVPESLDKQMTFRNTDMSIPGGIGAV